jgi:hypothetical protein
MSRDIFEDPGLFILPVLLVLPPAAARGKRACEDTSRSGRRAGALLHLRCFQYYG